MKKKLKFYFVLLACFSGMLYGSSYQQYRHFDITDPRGANDSISYVNMSYGNYDVDVVHKYRFIIPLMAGYIRAALSNFIGDKNELDKLSFYIANFFYSLASSFFLFELLRCLGFGVLLSVIGVSVFISSRITALVTGTPLVDSFYLASIVLILLLTVKEKTNHLVVVLPVLALSKETILPFLLIPLFTEIRRSVPYIASSIVSLAVVFIARQTIDRYSSAVDSDFFEIVQSHASEVYSNFSRILTLKGLHDLQNGYSAFLILAILGFFINKKYKIYNIPYFLHLTIPISLFFAILSGNLGRMFFASFPVVIPYVLVFVSYVCRQSCEEARPTSCWT